MAVVYNYISLILVSHEEFTSYFEMHLIFICKYRLQWHLPSSNLWNIFASRTTIICWSIFDINAVAVWQSPHIRRFVEISNSLILNIQWKGWGKWIDTNSSISNAKHNASFSLCLHNLMCFILSLSFCIIQSKSGT